MPQMRFAARAADLDAAHAVAVVRVLADRVGITRARVISLLADEGVAVDQRPVAPAELLTAREIFSTGNYGKVVPCTRYEQRDLPIGPVATLARRKYMDFAEGCRIEQPTVALAK